jgi:hypothetical protein
MHSGWIFSGRLNCSKTMAELICSYRFTRSEVYRLAEALDLPEDISCSKNQIKEDRAAALCMLLRRLAYPCHLVNMEMEFEWETSWISHISRLTAAYIWDRWKHLLHFNAEQLTPEALSRFAATFVAKGFPIPSIAAIINSTLKKVARPSLNQRILFNSWKRIHCLKYHLVATPDGIIIHVFGPMEGRCHDATLLKESGLTDTLEKHFWGSNGEQYYVYGDPAYQTAVISCHLTKGHRLLTSRGRGMRG